jgi:hypothetical protein
VSQLDLLDGILARPAHWAEPPSKIRTTWRPPVKVDYRAWLEHAAQCEPCAAASDDLAALAQLEWEPRPPCPVGMPLLPLADIEAACGGIDRGAAAAMVRRIIDHARQLDGWGAEALMGTGQALGRLG